jgi:hypothetical protein
MAVLRSPDNQIFYGWDEVAQYWIRDENAFDLDFPSTPQDPGTSLAAHIVENIFELELDPGSNGIGSYLPGYDVKNRDPYQIIQLSLADHRKEQKLYECYAQEDGTIKFYEINQNASSITNSQILYSISSSTLKQKCDNVIVTGYDPPSKKFTRPGSLGTQGYDMFTFAYYYTDAKAKGVNDRSSIYYDADWGAGGYPKYWILGDILGAEACEYYREGFIEFADPGLSDQNTLDERVYDNERGEKILGWIYKVEIPWFVQGSTQVDRPQKSPRYITLESFGELQQRTWTDNRWYKPQICLIGDRADTTKGVLLPDSDSSKFLGVREVYIYGCELTSIYPDEIVEDGELQPGVDDFVVTLNTMQNEPIKLSQGQDYVVVKDPDDPSGKYRIIFSCNISPNYIDKFGGSMGTSVLDSAVRFRISNASIFGPPGEGNEPTIPECEDMDFFDRDTPAGGACKGVLRDGITSVTSWDSYYGAIFPMGEGNSGYAMIGNAPGTTREPKIVVVYDWNNPCLHFVDQEDNVTKANLEAVTVELYAIINQDLKAPEAHCNGGTTTMLDPRQQIPDTNPDTVQDLANTPYQLAHESLKNGDIKITLPFIACEGMPWESCPELENVATFIYELQNHEVESTTHICDPEARPELGKTIDGQVINSIDYSYQDSSQYLISVQVGPVWQGMGGWDQSVYQNKVEQVQLEGVVSSVESDNTRCKVQLERIGLMECVNGQLEKLEIGDTVKVTVHNNPISI